MSKPKVRVTHSQITAGLREFAKQQKLSANVVYNRFFREVFLAELMAKNSGWVLKGGTNLYCLIPGARHTQDLDLYRQDSPTGHRDAAQTLITMMNHTEVGPYTFEVTNPRAETISGTIDNIQLSVIVRFGTSEFSRFSIDVSGDLEVPLVAEPVLMNRSDSLDVPFVPPTFPVWSYPVENQLADKVCAMYEVHGSGVSTRYRDLYDIGLIALELDVDTEKLRAALQTQERIRTLTLPTHMVLPGKEWLTGYKKFISTVHEPRLELKELDNAMTVAGALMNPILGNRS